MNAADDDEHDRLDDALAFHPRASKPGAILAATAAAGDVVLVTIPGTDFKPQARILRRSKVSGILTVELLEDVPLPDGTPSVYRAGCALHVAPYECRQRDLSS